MFIKSKIFTGTPEQVQEQMSSFLESRVVKIQGFAQSQSSGSGENTVIVTATLLYVEYEGSRSEISGFSSR